MMTKVRPLMDRFMEKIEFIPPCDCWFWSGAQDGKGYGLMSTKFKQSPIKAHRVSYELFNGIISDKLVVRHKCDIPSCVNPNHLEIGTQKENVLDTVKRNRLNPLSLLNLHPGEKGIYGAGTKSNKEMEKNVGK